MGYKPLEVAAVTLSQFQLILTGYQRRRDHEWNQTRHIMTAVINYAGWGAKDYIPPERVIELHSDLENTKQPIRSMKQAMRLFKDFQ